MIPRVARRPGLPADRAERPARTTTLASRLDDALDGATTSDDDDHLVALGEARPVDDHDGLVALGALHDLHLAPVGRLAGRERWQHHPALVALRSRLEEALLARVVDADVRTDWTDLPEADAAAALRRVARRDAVPEVYRWLAVEAALDEVVAFLALEGGPDGGFDDLIALCQVGLGGRAKLELARNYWDEMGRGSLAMVHTELHRRLARALRIPAVPRRDQPVVALERSLLGSTLVLNRRFQPEAVGALGLLELQAGPRCRRVLDGLERLGAPGDAFPFYAEHAEADPRHGKDWLDEAIAELAADPGWAAGIVRGARWRWVCNDRFLTVMAERFGGTAADDRREVAVSSSA